MLSDPQMIAHAGMMINDAFIGSLSTVDADGWPHSRYMAAVCEDDRLQRLFSVTGIETRKVEHIRAHRHVCWLLASAA